MIRTYARDDAFHLFGRIAVPSIDQALPSSPDGFDSMPGRAAIEFPNAKAGSSARSIGTIGDGGNGFDITGGIAGLRPPMRRCRPSMAPVLSGNIGD